MAHEAVSEEGDLSIDRAPLAVALSIHPSTVMLAAGWLVGILVAAGWILL